MYKILYSSYIKWLKIKQGTTYTTSRILNKIFITNFSKIGNYGLKRQWLYIKYLNPVYVLFSSKLDKLNTLRSMIEVYYFPNNYLFKLNGQIFKNIVGPKLNFSWQKSLATPLFILKSARIIVLWQDLHFFVIKQLTS